MTQAFEKLVAVGNAADLCACHTAARNDDEICINTALISLYNETFAALIKLPCRCRCAKLDIVPLQCKSQDIHDAVCGI